MDEFAHDLNTVSVVENDQIYSMLPKQILRAHKVSILSDNDAGNSVQQCRAGTHDAGTESADQSQVGPVATASGIPQAHCFGVRSRVAGLNAQIMTAGHDPPLTVGQDRSDGQTAFLQAFSGFDECFLQQRVIIHD